MSGRTSSPISPFHRCVRLSVSCRVVLESDEANIVVVPQGLYIRINLETGRKEAKLLE